MAHLEMLRFVRHGIAPLVILAVDRGWLPEAVQKDVIEFLAIGASLALAYGWSWLNERNNERDKLAAAQQASAVGSGGGSGGRGAENQRPHEKARGAG